MAAPKFSLVMATVDRVEEPQAFLASLAAQGRGDIELVVVDQNPDDRLVPVLQPYETTFAIRHLRSERGLSRARNVGLVGLSGEIVGFPDDDCRYPPGLLDRVSGMLDADPALGGVTGRSVDGVGGSSGGRWAPRRSPVTKAGVWTRGISYTIFLRRDAVAQIGGFDETLGVGGGTPWGAGEETDFLLRALAAGSSVVYHPSIQVIHPVSSPAPERAAGYARGMGRVLRLHRYPLWQMLYHLARPAGGAVLALARGDLAAARHHRAILTGRFSGLTDGLPD